MTETPTSELSRRLAQSSLHPIPQQPLLGFRFENVFGSPDVPSNPKRQTRQRSHSSSSALSPLSQADLNRRPLNHFRKRLQSACSESGYSSSSTPAGLDESSFDLTPHSATMSWDDEEPELACYCSPQSAPTGLSPPRSGSASKMRSRRNSARRVDPTGRPERSRSRCSSRGGGGDSPDLLSLSSGGFIMRPQALFKRSASAPTSRRRVSPPMDCDVVDMIADGTDVIDDVFVENVAEEVLPSLEMSPAELFAAPDASAATSTAFPPAIHIEELSDMEQQSPCHIALRPASRNLAVPLPTYAQPAPSLPQPSSQNFAWHAQPNAPPPESDVRLPFRHVEDSQYGSLRVVTAETVRDLVQGAYASQFSRVVVVDCRFPYEYEGGHIRGAINVNSARELAYRFVTHPIIDLTDRSRTAIVFHCEFSRYRGPTLYRQLRMLDARLTKSDGYGLFPEMFLMEGGYSTFFERFQGDQCEPPTYRPMDDPEFKSDCEQGDVFILKSKEFCKEELAPELQNLLAWISEMGIDDAVEHHVHVQTQRLLTEKMCASPRTPQSQIR